MFFIFHRENDALLATKCKKKGRLLETAFSQTRLTYFTDPISLRTKGEITRSTTPPTAAICARYK